MRHIKVFSCFFYALVYTHLDISLSAKNTHSKVYFLILGIDIILIVQYTFSMSIYDIKADNLVKLLDGLSLLDERDQERIISVIDALDFAYEKAETVAGSCEEMEGLCLNY